jgi:hypothetical protein
MSNASMVNVIELRRHAMPTSIFVCYWQSIPRLMASISAAKLAWKHSLIRPRRKSSPRQLLSNNIDINHSSKQLTTPSSPFAHGNMATLSICRSCLRNTHRTRPLATHPRIPRRAASNTTNTSKPIVLEQPDAFRPPSHPQRLNRRRRPNPNAYNQESTQQEQQRQRTRRYPHMFPNQGTFMHWFLTDRWIHLWITMV